MLSIDIETFSSVDLKSCGVFAYCESFDFEILLIAYAFDNEDVSIIDLKNKDRVPDSFLSALNNPDIIKTAFNAGFEICALEKYFNITLETRQWECTYARALSMGLPFNLSVLSKYLNIKKEKMKEGKGLINLFKSRENLDNCDKKTWDMFKDYCIRDAQCERAIRKVLNPIPLSEQRLWVLDQEINKRGILVDEVLVNNAIDAYKGYEDILKKEFMDIAGFSQSSLKDFKAYLIKRGIKAYTLNRESILKLLKDSSLDDDIKKLLKIRLELSKTSIKKYEAIKRALSYDKRLRGLFRFYGAVKTGRWTSKIVQLQNLPQSNLNLDIPRELLKRGDYSLIDLFYESMPKVLSNLIRTSFIAKPNSRFIISDFSAIEARVIAWLSNEEWRLNVFKSHGKIYEASASKMFNIPIEDIKKGSELRQKGKIAELALGYQGGEGALISMGALKMGLSNEDIKSLVESFRNSNKNIVSLWRNLERSAVLSIKTRRPITSYKGIVFSCENSVLFVKLPSGRRLAYLKPMLEKDNRFYRDVLTYESLEQATKQWKRQKTYGGRLCENIVQAIARDCLGEAMINLSDNGYKIVMHVHDEVVLECEDGVGSIKEVNFIMSKEIIWARGLPLKAESFESLYYKKG